MCYNGVSKTKRRRKLEQISKEHPSSDCPLQLEGIKLESLVIADQHAAVNMYPSLVHTARHALEVHFVGKHEFNNFIVY